MHTWLASSLIRHYPSSRPRKRSALTLHAARGETVSFQVAFRTDNSDLKVTATSTAPEPLTVQVRRVGYVPLLHHSTMTEPEELDGFGHLPGLVPDPLFPEGTIHAGPFETNAFWITVRVPADAKPGRYPVTLSLKAEHVEPAELTASLRVHRAVLPPRRDFPVTHWFYADALCDWYHTDLWKDSFWPILDAYLADLVSHGQDTILVPLFTPPTDGVKRPTQLLRVGRDGDRYSFDWTLVRRWIKAANAQGLTYFEWPHLFTQWGVHHAVRIYEGHGADGKLLWPPETAATGSAYRGFLAQFLPEFERFLRAEGILDRSFFHVSDEPHGDEHLANYRAARALLRELAPWMKVMDALSDIRLAREGLADIPIPQIDVAQDFIREGFSPWTYFACYPRGRFLNRQLDTPLIKVRMTGWLFYRTQVRGFLHWGYNYWYKSQTTELIDPYQITDSLAWPNWAPGDACMVYPGDAGPVDSLRWEIFAESLQDYALLQAVGVAAADPMLSDIHDYADFPRREAWIAQRRRELLRRLSRGR